MALVDTECFMIYYDNFIGILNKSTAAKGQKKNKNIIFFVHRQSLLCLKPNLTNELTYAIIPSYVK